MHCSRQTRALVVAARDSDQKVVGVGERGGVNFAANVAFAARDKTLLSPREGMPHAFFGQGLVLGDAKDAVEFAGSRIKGAFEN